MKNKTQPLRNDQNNHLRNQVKIFEKRPVASKTMSATEKSYAVKNHDNVTATYIRGYN